MRHVIHEVHEVLGLGPYRPPAPAARQAAGGLWQHLPVVYVLDGAGTGLVKVGRALNWYAAQVRAERYGTTHGLQLRVMATATVTDRAAAQRLERDVHAYLHTRRARRAPFIGPREIFRMPADQACTLLRVRARELGLLVRFDQPPLPGPRQIAAPSTRPPGG